MKTALHKIVFSLALLMLVSLSACAAPAQAPAVTPAPAASPTPAPVTLTDGLGKSFTFDKPYQKIVSLAPSNTEILFAIGAGSQVVARDTFSDYPEAAKQVKDIGGGWGEVDTEAIVALAPDLVLAAEINATEQVKSLEDLGLNVYYLSNPKTLDGMYDNLRTVARLTGHEAETETLIESLKNRVAAVDAKIASVAEKPVVFYELDGSDPNAPWTSGPGTFVDLLVSKAGGANLGNLLDGAWAQISVENLVTEDPDVIVLGDAVWGGVTPEAVAARTGWDSLDAVQNGKVFPFDDNLISRPGPRMVDGLEQLAKLLHPELFQ
jgi:iron complex transport system substrate-binding protein